MRHHPTHTQKRIPLLHVFLQIYMCAWPEWWLSRRWCVLSFGWFAHPAVSFVLSCVAIYLSTQPHACSKQTMVMIDGGSTRARAQQQRWPDWQGGVVSCAFFCTGGIRILQACAASWITSSVSNAMKMSDAYVFDMSMCVCHCRCDMYAWHSTHSPCVYIYIYIYIYI